MTTTPDTSAETVDIGGVTWHRTVHDGGRHLPDWGTWRVHDSRDGTGPPPVDVRFCREYRCGLAEVRDHLDTTPTVEEIAAAREAEGTMTVTAAVAGSPTDPFAVTVCAHKTFTFQAAVVTLVDDGSGRREGTQAQFKVRCGQCSQRMTFDLDEGARIAPDGFTLGVFVVPFDGE